MSLPQVVSRDEWLVAARSCWPEKAMTRVREISDGLLAHLHTRDTTLVFVSRAPLAKIEVYKARKGWTFPWCSSYGSDFNYDFHVTLDESVAPVEYNYRTKAEHEQAGTSYYVSRIAVTVRTRPRS